jgi:adenylate kinase
MLIFIAGAHGVGKGYLCEKYKAECNVTYKSASEIIRESGNITLPANKLATDLDRNQLILISALESLLKNEEKILLDGHFCLIQKNGEVIKLTKTIFKHLNIDGVILLENDSNTIKKRIIERDGNEPPYDIELLSQMEKENALLICKELNIPIKILNSSTLDEFKNAMSELERELSSSAQ